MQIDRPIAIALILFVILLLVFFLVAPEYNNFGKLQTELGKKTAEYNAEFDYYSAISKTYQDLQSHKDDISKIDDALPSDPTLGRTMYALQQIAKENGMIVKSVFISKGGQSSGSQAKTAVVTAKNVGAISISVNAMGSYESLEHFMIALEKSSRIFEVTNISFGSKSGGGTGATQSQAKSQFQAQDMTDFSLQIKTNTY